MQWRELILHHKAHTFVGNFGVIPFHIYSLTSFFQHVCLEVYEKRRHTFIANIVAFVSRCVATYENVTDIQKN